VRRIRAGRPRGRLRVPAPLRAPLTAAGASVVVLVAVAAAAAPLIAPYPADGGTAVHPEDVLLPPDGAHWLGTDQVGRDVLTRTLYGARTSLTVVAAVLGLSALIGVPLGVAAGYLGGWPRAVLLRITDVFLAFPALLLALALAAVLTPSATSAVIAVVAGWWPWYARLAYAQSASVSRRGFVTASRALGVSGVRTVLRHVLPNSMSAVLAQLFLDAGAVLLTVAALSYLGIGVQEPTAEWGLAVYQGQGLLSTSWWVAVPPGLALLLTAAAFTLLGDGLRVALDPRSSRAVSVR
jgi:peptide/nickel transport system permease protein